MTDRAEVGTPPGKPMNSVKPPAAPASNNLYTEGHTSVESHARAARQDLIQGLLLWDMWKRLCFNEIRRRYRRTLLGPMWVSVSLGVFAIAVAVVWSALFNLPFRDFLPYLLSGLVAWTMLGSCLGEACVAFVGAEGIMKARQIPCTMLIHVLVARNLIILGHNLVAYVIVAAISGVSVTASTLLFIPGVVLLALNMSWMSLMIAILCLRYRDVQQLVTIMLQIAMLVTPVLWPVSLLAGRKAIIADVNLLYHLLDVVRSPLLGKTPALLSYAVCVAAAVLGWMAAYRLLVKKRHRLVYWF